MAAAVLAAASVYAGQRWHPMEPLKVFNLGQLGVQLVASPLHQKPASEVIRAQNAIYDKVSNAGGLTKRGGLAKVNAAALNAGAAIHGGLFVAFPDPVAPLAASNEAGRGFYVLNTVNVAVTEVPATWTPETRYTSNELLTSAALSYFWRNSDADHPFPLGVSLPGRVYYAGGDITDAAGNIRIPINKWDGSVATNVAVPPLPPQTGAGIIARIASIHVFDGNIYLSTFDDTNAAQPFTASAFGRVFKLDVNTEDLAQIGASTFGTHTGGLVGGMPGAMAWFEGSLFVATTPSNPATVPRVYSIRPGVDEDWTLEDATAAAGLSYTGLHVYLGNLYATTRSLAGGTASIIRRRVNGTWATVRTNASTLIENAYFGMATLGATLYVVERDEMAVNDDLAIFTSTTGAAYASSRVIRTADFAATAVGVLRGAMPVVADGFLYYTFRHIDGVSGSSVIVRSNGGAWAQVRVIGIGFVASQSEVLMGPLRD